MSTDLFARRPIHEPADIAGHVLLATETRPGDWSDWLETAGLSHMTGQRRQLFDHFYVTLQAIVDGLGVGIGSFPLLDADIVAGRIIAPLPNIKVSRTGYVTLVPFDADKTAPFGGFVDWLIDEGRPGKTTTLQIINYGSKA
jgi:LysR family glycine cleavage system transcriptional activator